MLTVHPQYLKGADGKNSLVVLPAKEFELIMEELADLRQIELYAEAEKNNTGERILIK